MSANVSWLPSVLAAAALLLLGGCPEERPGAERKIPGERFPPAESVRAPAGTATPPLIFRRPGAATVGPSPGSPVPARDAPAQPAPPAAQPGAPVQPGSQQR